MHPLLFTEADKAKAITSKLPLQYPFLWSLPHSYPVTKQLQRLLILFHSSFGFAFSLSNKIHTTCLYFRIHLCLPYITFLSLSSGKFYLQQIYSFQNKQLLLSFTLLPIPEFLLNSHILSPFLSSSFLSLNLSSKKNTQGSIVLAHCAIFTASILFQQFLQSFLHLSASIPCSSHVINTLY